MISHKNDPPSDLFSIRIHRPMDRHIPSISSNTKKRTDIPFLIIIVQSAIIFITLTAFILYVLNPRHLPMINPSQPSFEVSIQTKETTTEKEYSSYSRSSSSEESEEELSSHTMMAKFKKAAVVSDHGICSEIGRRILTRGGNAVDASIATLLCVGATNPHSSGIGGGFFMVIYQKDKQECKSINARETAPQLANEKIYKEDKTASSYGYKSIGVPGEIKGMWRAFNDYGSGKVEWKDLVMPTVQLCREGIPVSEYLTRVLQDEKRNIAKNDDFRLMFTNPNTSELYKEGDIMYRPNLASTLQRLAESDDPVWLFYHGDIAETITDEMKDNGGLIREEDLEDYEPLVSSGILSQLSPSLIQCGPPPPSSWIVTQLIVSIMKELYPFPQKKDLESIEFYHRLIEAEKFAYALRTHLGDPIYTKGMDEMTRNLTDPMTAKRISEKIKENTLKDEEYGADGYMKEDHGTSHVSVIDEDGNAVSVTSTINLWLGAKVSSRLGIIWNNEMDDFSISGMDNAFGFAPSRNNLIQPGKTPVSSMSPTIVFNNTDGQVRIVIGTTGGSKIIQGVAIGIIRSVLFGETIKEAIDAPHVYHQLHPSHVQYENDFPKDILEGLRDRGHETHLETGMHSTTHAIYVDQHDGYIYANSDKRSHVHMHPDGY